MHRLDKYGDDLFSVRPIIKAVNQEVTLKSGFEAGGVYGFYFRIIKPVLDVNGTHHGSFEYGVRFEHFAQAVKALMTHTQLAFLVKKEVLKTTNKQEGFYDYDEYKVVVNNEPLFKDQMQLLDLSKPYQVLEVDDKTYMISANFFLNNFRGDPIIRVVSAVDITRFKKELTDNFLLLLVIASVAMLISIFIMHYGFNYFIQVQKTLNKKIQTYVEVVDENVMTVTVNKEGEIKAISTAFCKKIAFDKGELIGKKMTEFLCDKTTSILTQKQGERCLITKEEEPLWISFTLSTHFNKEEKIKGFTIVCHDISAKKKLEEVSVRDKLTGAFNRVKLDEVLESEVHRAKRYKHPFSIILLDIDDFKQTNDTYGHLVGDAILVEMKKVIELSLRSTDILGRWGGEEFMIICPETSLDEGKIVAEKVRAKIANHAFPHVKQKTASFGVSSYRDEERLESMIKRCDEALYEAKNLGKNRVEVL